MIALTPYGWYYRLSSFFRERFGERVYKIPLHAGLTCPNRDGTISTGGCSFCYNPGFSPGARSHETPGSPLTVKEQILRYQAGMERGRKNRASAGSEDKFHPQRKYLAYFQSYSNTYAPVSTLRSMYEEALGQPGIVGLSVATRPDCLTLDVLDLLGGYARRYHLWLELGLQSSHDRTLQLINRGHNFSQFEEAVRTAAGRSIFICAHIINGLPGESRSDMLETVLKLNRLPVDGIKFHQLQVLKDTPLAELFYRGKVKHLQMQEYLEILAGQLEILNGGTVVHRLLSEVTDPGLLLAPLWQVSRARFSGMVEAELKSRRTCQGINSPPPLA